MFSFWRNCQKFSYGCSACFPSPMRGSYFLSTNRTIDACYYPSFLLDILVNKKWLSKYAFVLCVSNDLWCRPSFLCLLAICMPSLQTNKFKSPVYYKVWVIYHLLLSCKSLRFSREWEVCTAFLLSLGSEQGVCSGSRSAEHLFRTAVRKPFSHFFFLKATIPLMLNPTPVPSAAGGSPFSILSKFLTSQMVPI